MTNGNLPKPVAYTQDEVRHAESLVRDRFLADAFWVVLEQVARYHPDAIQKALEGIYPPPALYERLRRHETQCQRVVEMAENALKYARQARELMEEINDQLDSVQERLDWLEVQSQRLERRA